MRTLLVPLETHRRRILATSLVLVVAGGLAWSAIRRAVADELGQRAASVPQAERAVAWDPANPDRHLYVAGLQGDVLEGGDPLRARVHIAAALRQRPTDGGAWLRLALLEDRAGRVEQARHALATAVRYDGHSVSLRWEAALLGLRWGDREAAIDHFRYVIENDPAQRDAAFQLARSLFAPEEPVASLLPAAPEALAAILRLAVRDREVQLARVAWERRATMQPPLPADLQRRFLDLLLDEGEGALARRLWAGPAPAGQSAEADVIWNGSFEQPQLLGWGFDWQVRRVWGVETRLDGSNAAEGAQALRLAFNAFPTLDYAGVSQVVPVQPGEHYRLSALVRALDFVTRSGLKVQVVTRDAGRVVAETGPIAGTTDGWVRVETLVSVPQDVSLVRVRLRREPAPSPEGNLGGKVWVDAVRMEPVKGKRS